jgi:hypothetical protein
VVGWADSNIAPSSSHLYSQQQNAYPTTPAPLPANATTTTTTTHRRAPPVITADRASRPAPIRSNRKDLNAAGYVRNASGEWVDAPGGQLTLRMVVDTGDGWAAERPGSSSPNSSNRPAFHVTVTSEPDRRPRPASTCPPGRPTWP